MPEISSLLGFVTASLVVLLIPGPAVLYVVARSISQGRRAGLISVLGLSTGALVHRLFADGFVISVLNPKIAVFFLAFLPQFVQPASGPVLHQILLFGLLYVALALLTDGSYAYFASSLRRRFWSLAFHGPLPRYASGGVYIGLGVTTALAERP